MYNGESKDGPASAGTHSSMVSQGVVLRAPVPRGANPGDHLEETARTASLGVEEAPLLGGDAVPRDVLAKFQHPPDNDFHTHEYGIGLEGETLARPVSSSSEELCKKCHTDDPLELQSWSMVFAFLALTSGPSLTYLCFSLSVEFFVEDIGMRVLMLCGVAYSIPCLLGLVFFNASRFFLSPRTTLVGCLLTKAVFTMAIPAFVVARGHVGASVTYTCMGINGFATGLVQSQVAAISGLLPGSKADSLAHIGSSLSALVTTMLQAVLLGLRPMGVPIDARTRVLVLFPAATAILLYGLFAQHQVLSMPTYVELAKAEQRRLKKLNKALGKAKVLGRLGSIKWYLVGELLTWFVGLFATAVTPFLKVTSSAPLLLRSYATLLVMAFNVFNFVGGVAARWWVSWTPPKEITRVAAACSPRFRRLALAVSVVLRLGFCVFYVLYSRSCGWDLGPVPSSIVVFTTFSVLSAGTGFYTVSLSAECQRLCGFSAAHLCPVVGALVWQSMQLGCVLGFAASALAAPLMEPLNCSFPRLS